MQLALLRAFEMGAHMLPFYPDNPVCWIVWGVFLLGFGIQLLLLRSSNRWIRRMLAIGLVIGMLACEIACQIVTGWELVGLILLEFFLLTMLVGAGLGAGFVRWRRNKRTKKSV